MLTSTLCFLPTTLKDVFLIYFKVNLVITVTVHST